VVESTALLKRRRGKTLPRVRIPPSPFAFARAAANRSRFSISALGLLSRSPAVLDLCLLRAILLLRFLQIVYDRQTLHGRLAGFVVYMAVQIEDALVDMADPFPHHDLGYAAQQSVADEVMPKRVNLPL
jgi:hypothetical protein